MVRVREAIFSGIAIVDLIKIPAFVPEGNLISISFRVYLSGHRGAVSALPCRLTEAGFTLTMLQNTHLYLTHPQACLAVKWLCHRHAQFVSFHPGLMSRIYPGAKCTVWNPSRRGSCNMQWLVCLCLMFRVGGNRVITLAVLLHKQGPLKWGGKQ